MSTPLHWELRAEERYDGAVEPVVLFVAVLGEGPATRQFLGAAEVEQRTSLVDRRHNDAGAGVRNAVANLSVVNIELMGFATAPVLAMA